MSVLYRTYRPKSWSEVVGQDQIVDVLKESIKLGRISHAYLFSGSRGTGKTTLARIFAQAVETADEDVYEIDAASNRGIDDIRELRSHVSVSPFTSKYKVYIIDEVHMLSKDAWNALLKTLEEPPAHVIFILATTELDKVPDTIISRCQTFVFRKPAREVVRKLVLSVSKKEGYDLDSGGADIIALLGDGSFRDALGMLEKVIASSSQKKITREEVEAITGAPRSAFVNSLIEALIANNADAGLEVIGRAEKTGVSINTLITLVLEKIRFILIAEKSPTSKEEIMSRVSPDDWQFIDAQSLKKAVTTDMLSILLEAAIQTERARIEALPLEMAVVNICK